MACASAGFEDYAAAQAGIEAGYLEVAGETGAHGAPAGIAWQRAREQNPQLETYGKGTRSIPPRKGPIWSPVSFTRPCPGAEPRGRLSYLAGSAGGELRDSCNLSLAETVSGDHRALEYALMALPVARCGVSFYWRTLVDA